MDEGFGLVYDVALTCSLWESGRRFIRYRSLSLLHRYRAAGGYASVEKGPQARRARENKLLRRLAKRYPELIEFRVKPSASLGTMQYNFRNVGPEPPELRPPRPMSGGRRTEGFADRPMTAAERQRKSRLGVKALVNNPVVKKRMPRTDASRSALCSDLAGGGSR